MGIEIERKFLVAGDGWRSAVTRSTALRQGYLVERGGRSSVRVRIGGDEARLNIKAAIVGAARAEYDYALPLAEAREILDTLCVGGIDKTRHFVDAGGRLVWEIDEFHGANAGLVVAEIELDHEEQPFSRPDWLGAEVTAHARYYNHALALNPYRDWTDADRLPAATSADSVDAGHRPAPPAAGRA